MIDLDRELRALDEIPTPDLGEGVRGLRPGDPDDDRSPFARAVPTRIMVIATVTAICLVAGGLVWRAFTAGDEGRPATPGPVDVANGDIWVQVGGGDGATAIWRVDADGDTDPLWTDSGGVFVGTPVEPALIADDYAFSPDGSRVVFSAQVRPGGSDQPRELFVMNVDGTNLRQMTFDGAYAGFPAWSPDGTTLVYASYRGTEYIPGCLGFAICASDLYVVPVTGGAPSMLVGSDASETTPTWSSDGTRIGYAEVGQGGSGTIVTVGVDGSDRVEVGPRGDVSFPAWSPDGERILFFRGQGGTQHVWTVSPDGSSLHDVIDTRVDTNFGRPLWSPEGDRIAFARPYAGVVSIWLVDPAGDGPPERIGGWPGFDAAPIAWRPVVRDRTPAPTSSTRVPDVVGLTLDEATSVMAASGLSVGVVEYIPSSAVQEGSVVSTEPWAGTEFELPPRFEVSVIVSSGPVDEGPTALPGIDAYQVCRITRMQGDFGSAGDEVVVFEEERVPGAGCTQSEGFQHIAVLRGGEVTALSRRVTDIVTDDAWKVWPYATPDLDGDGIDEIVLATVRSGSGRHLWFFKVQSGGIDPVSEGGAAFNIVIGTAAHENGTQAAQGLYCEGSDDSRTVVIWQAGADDALEVSESVWRLDGVTMGLVVKRATRISGAGAYPPLGDVELCGSPVAGKG